MRYAFCHLPSHLVSGPREGDAIRERVKAGLDTSIPSHYSPQLADLVKDLLSYNVRVHSLYQNNPASMLTDCFRLRPFFHSLRSPAL